MPHTHTSEFDFSQITENIFLGTNLCCKNKKHLDILQEIGIDVDIDLEEERQDSPPKIDIYLWLPTKDKSAPNISQIMVAVNVITLAVKLDKKIYIHCRYGHGRSPTLIAAYFISTGYTVSEAVTKIKEARPEIHLEMCQLKALQEYYEKIN